MLVLILPGMMLVLDAQSTRITITKDRDAAFSAA
jgi:hypothetical protein